MSIENEISHWVEKTRDAYELYENARSILDEKLEIYYSEVFGIKIDETYVFEVSTGKKILVTGFEQSENVYERPVVVGKLVLPFGLSNKAKQFGPSEWETEAEKRGEKNGNFRFDSCSEPNGNC